MKRKERIEYLVDSFVDENNEKRYAVIAAISVPYESDVYNIDDDYIFSIYKGVKLGMSICNPVDKFDEQLGIKIAIGRAQKNSEFALLATKPGYINTTMIQGFLKQEMEYFKNNPAQYIAGYKRKKVEK